MDRREFVKRAGVGSIGLGALAASPAALAGGPGFPKGGGHQHFTLVALSGTTPAVVDGIQHMMVLEGAGTFKASSGHADGGGNFVHLNFAAPTAPGQPIASGKWEVTDLISYSTPVGDYGRVRASIVTVSVQLHPDAGGSVSGSVVSFSGPGRLILDGAQKVDVNVEVWVDVETQTFQLTVLGVATLPV